MWWKKFKRRQRFARKRNLTYLLFLFILFSMGIGYAILSSNLSITGASLLASARWDVHFENIVVKEGSVTPTTEATITDDTTVAFSVTLENPGDYYDFNIDVVNGGTIDAMIEAISIQPVLTENQQKYLDYIVTYEEGGALAEHQSLDAGDSETLRIAFIYKTLDNSDDYPEEDEDISISISITYIQATDDVVDVPRAPTVYNVLRTATKEGTYAREYTGSHHDSFTEEPAKKIYHWHSENGTGGKEILDKNNVIFAGHCWQMIRTTDTGGVKMIYNGEVENNQCLNTRGTHVGYSSRTTQNLASNYWYGTDYTYDSSTKTFKVSGETEQVTWNSSTRAGLIGKYTCKNTSVDGTCSILYLVESSYSTSSAYVIPLNSESHYSQFGTLKFNESYKSMAYVGYMYGDVYTHSSSSLNTSSTKLYTQVEGFFSSGTVNTSYWYADSVDFGNLASNKYSLISPEQISSSSDYSNLVGKYTFQSTNMNNTATFVFYIASVDGTTIYYKRLENGNLYSNYDPVVVGDSITDNGDGTYTINNPTSVSLSDWNTTYANYNKKYTCGDNSITCTNPRYIYSASKRGYTSILASEKTVLGKRRDGLTLLDTITVRLDELSKNPNNYSDYKYTCNTDSATCTEAQLSLITSYTESRYNYVPNTYYGSGVTWDGTNYTLVDTLEIEDNKNLEKLSTHHYFCRTIGQKTCQTVGYVFYYNASEDSNYYITLSNGVSSIAQTLDNMLTKNTTNSTIKTGVEAWYKHTLLDYDDYIEDTIMCNDRSFKSIGGWKDDGGMTNVISTFNSHSSTVGLDCPNVTDQFSVSNSRAKLTYKVGLMTFPEMVMVNLYAISTGKKYWLLTPYGVNASTPGRAYGTGVDTSVAMYNCEIASGLGVRPAISLKAGTIYSSGDGSMENPYIVDTN